MTSSNCRIHEPQPTSYIMASRAGHKDWMDKECCRCKCRINSVEKHTKCQNSLCEQPRCDKCPVGENHWASEVQGEVRPGTSEDGLGTDSDGTREVGSSDSGIDAGNE